MTFTLRLYVLSLLLLQSCMPDRCGDTLCSNGGLCVDGQCACLNGYEGEHCDGVWNERFPGSWVCKDVVRGEAAGDTLTHQITVLSAGRPDQFLILNLSLSYDSVYCLRKSYYEFSFAANQQRDSITTILDGTGLIDTASKKVTASYRVKVKNETLTHDMIWTK